MKLSLSCMFVCSVLVSGLCPSEAQGQNVQTGLAKALWASETIHSIRSTTDYKALLALVLTEAATRTNSYPTAEKLQNAIALAQQLSDQTPIVTLDPDLNPAVFREKLETLRNKGILPEDSLNTLISELSRTAAEANEEEAILRQSTVARVDHEDLAKALKVSVASIR